MTRAKDISKIVSDANFGGTLDVGGAVTANAGVAVDNITIDGTEIDLSSGDLTIDVEGKIALDANDDGSIKLQDNGTEYARIDGNSSNLRIISQISDKDIIFNGNDGGSSITALTLDMSEAGDATFNRNVYLVDDGKIRFGASNDLQITHDGTDSYIDEGGTGSLRIRSNRVRLSKYTGENMIECLEDGAVELYHDSNKKLETTSTGVNVTGAVNIGGTGAANALDDYEEGTWTPNLNDLSNTPTYHNLTGKYTKIGRQCTVQYFAQTNQAPTFNTTSGEFKVTGLPFTVLGSGYTGSQGTVNAQGLYYHGGNNNQGVTGSATTGGCYLTAAVNASEQMYFQVTISGGTRGIVNNVGAAQGFVIEATVTYFTLD